MSGYTLTLRSSYEAREAAIKLGATHEHIAYYPERYNPWGEFQCARPLSYHFFRNGVEIAMFMVCPKGEPITGELQTFDPPRMWGIPHDLKEIP